MEYSVSTLKVNKLQAATGSSVSLESGQRLVQSGMMLQCQTVTSDTDTTLSTGVSYQIPVSSTPTISNGYTLLQLSLIHI